MPFLTWSFFPRSTKADTRRERPLSRLRLPLLLGMIAAESTAHIPALAWMDSDDGTGGGSCRCWRRAWPVTRPFCRWRTEGRPNALNGWICRTGRPESTRNTEAGRRAGERTETWKQPLCLRIGPRTGDGPNPPHMTECIWRAAPSRPPHGKSPRAVSFEGFLGAATGIAMQPERRARPDARLSRSAFRQETALRSGMDAAGARRGSARPGVRRQRAVL